MLTKLNAQENVRKLEWVCFASLMLNLPYARYTPYILNDYYTPLYINYYFNQYALAIY